MPSSAETSETLSRLMEVRALGVDDFSALRYLYAKSLTGQAADAVSDAAAEELVRLVYSPEFVDLVGGEEVIGAFLHGELAGSAAWHGGRDTGAVARIGPVLVRHPGFGIGRRLLSEVEGRARAAGFTHFATWATQAAVPFFVIQGYQVTSRGAKTVAPGFTLPVTFLRKVVA